MRTLKILVIDDDEIICTLLQALLTKYGHQVITHTSAQQGVAAARTGQFDLALLDIRMPVMNGVEALKQLRPLLPKARFVMITGLAEDEMVGEAFSHGASLCLAKPVNPQKLDELLSTLFPE